jgi:transposase
MRQKSDQPETADQYPGEIRRATGKWCSVEEKIGIVLSGLRGEHLIAELYRREGIAKSLYCSWSKEFLEAGKKQLTGDTERQASSGEVKELRQQTKEFKELVAKLTAENQLRKICMTGAGGGQERGIPRPRGSKSSALLNGRIYRSSGLSAS